MEVGSEIGGMCCKLRLMWLPHREDGTVCISRSDVMRCDDIVVRCKIASGKLRRWWGHRAKPSCAWKAMLCGGAACAALVGLPCVAPPPPFLGPLWPSPSAAGVILEGSFVFFGCVATRRAAWPLLSIALHDYKATISR